MAGTPSSVPLTRRPISFALLTVVASVAFIGLGLSLAWVHYFFPIGAPCGYANGCNRDLDYAVSIAVTIAPAPLLGWTLFASIRAWRRGSRVWPAWLAGVIGLVAVFVVGVLIAGAIMGWAGFN